MLRDTLVCHDAISGVSQIFFQILVCYLLKSLRTIELMCSSLARIFSRGKGDFQNFCMENFLSKTLAN